MASRTVRKLKQGKKKSKESCCAPAPFIVVTPPGREGATTVGNYCSSSSSTSYEGVHFHGTCSAARPTPASPSSKQLNSAFFQNEVVTSGVVRSQLFHSVGEVHSPQLAALRASGGVAAGPYKPVPPPRPLGASPAVRGPGAPYIPPPAPSPGLPGAAPQPLHTHSSKFPIEREVVVSNCDKSAKIPVVQQYRRAVAVAPDAPPRLQAAWTLPQNMQNQQSATSPDGFRQAGPSRNCIPQEPNNAVSPPVPLKQTFIYGTRADCKYDDTPNGQSQSVSANDSTKEGNKESKSTSKAMTKTYHTLKDMISSRFKGKDSNESESKSNDAEAGLNNVTEELRKSMRERAEQEANNAAINAAREISRKTAGEQGIYGRPVPQQRGIASDLQYSRHLVQMHPLQNNAVQGQYQGQIQPVQQPGNQTPNQLLTQQQYLQQQLMLNQQQQHILGHGPSASSTPQHGLVQARSQELINRQNMLTDGIQRPHSQMMQQLTTADSIYYQPQYNQQRNVNRNVNYQSEIQQNSNYPALKQPPSNQMDTADSRSADLRSPQQLEREILRQRGLIEGHRTASQPQLPMDDDQIDLRFDQMDPSTPIATNKVIPMRRGSHGNLIETLTRTPIAGMEHEKDSDDGGFRTRLNAQGRSFDSKDRPGTSAMSYNNRQLDVNSKVNKTEINGDKNDNIYSGMKQPIFNGLPQAAQRQIDISEDVGSTNVKKVNPGSTASSDYDKNGGPSSNVDSGRGSAAYSSGRRVGHDTSTESDPLPGSTNGRPNVVSAEHNTTNSKHFHDKNGIGGDSEWVDIVESELRQILEPKLHGLSLNGNNNGQGVGNGVTGSETVSSVTPPLPPLSPAPSSPEATPRNSARFKHQSLPYGSKPEYGSENRTVMPNQRAGWQHTSKHRSGGSKKQEHSSQYKKHMFGLDTTDITSTTTRSLDLSSMLDGQSDSDVSTQDARAIRRQLQGLENMYCEVLKLLGVRKPTNHGLGKYQPSDPRLAKRRYGSVSSLPSSSVSSRPVRDKRRNATEQRKKVNDIKGINKRFQRLESHVVTLARSVAHLSSEMRTQHLMIQEMENIRGEITALRNQQRSQSMPRMDTNFCTINGYGGVDASSLANPSRVKKLTKFFGDEPPLLRMFLKKLGYEKYASLLENERVGAAELPFLGEERLRALGVPLGPRLRILHEARLALPPANTPHTTLCIV